MPTFGSVDHSSDDSDDGVNLNDRESTMEKDGAGIDGTVARSSRPVD